MRFSIATRFFICVVVLFITAIGIHGDDKKKTNTNKKNDGDKKIDDEKLGVIVRRQKGDVLKVYVDNRGMFVNGKSVTSDELAKLVKKTKLAKSKVTAQASLKMAKVLEVIDVLQGQGVKEFTLTTQTQEKSDVQNGNDLASKAKKNVFNQKKSKDNKAPKARMDGEKIAIIIHRQKGDTVKVYMNSHGTYVNGKSVNPTELKTVIKKSGLNLASVSAESYVAKEKIHNVEKIIQDAGIKNVVRTKVKKSKSEKN